MIAPPTTSAPLPVAFAASDAGDWIIDRVDAVIGECLPLAARLQEFEGAASPPSHAAWTLRGVTSNARYTHRAELDTLAAQQEALRRAEATRAALIPIRKSAACGRLDRMSDALSLKSSRTISGSVSTICPLSPAASTTAVISASDSTS
jgi:hypothetical protein